MQPIANPFEYIDATRMRAALYVINDAAYAHLAAPGDVASGETRSAPFLRYGEYDAKVSCLARCLEVGPVQHIRGKMVRGSEPAHGIS